MKGQLVSRSGQDFVDHVKVIMSTEELTFDWPASQVSEGDAAAAAASLL